VRTTTCQHSKETGVELDKEQGYELVPKSVKITHENKVPTSWNQQVKTDRATPNNKRDNIIRDNENKTRMLTDAATSGDRNLIKKKAENI
jgi:hypothetical protein